MLEAKTVIQTEGEDYVFERENETFGLAQIWPIKVNKDFYSKFEVSTGTNPDHKIFQPQAVFEFERSIKRLFGDDALDRVQILYAKNTNTNKLPIYKGSAAALESYLRAHPEAVDQLKIAKLFPGGFVATVTIEKKKKNGYKQFDFTPGIEYVLYTKQGFESMACIKMYSAFERECDFLEEIVPTVDQRYDA